MSRAWTLNKSKRKEKKKKRRKRGKQEETAEGNIRPEAWSLGSEFKLISFVSEIIIMFRLFDFQPGGLKTRTGPGECSKSCVRLIGELRGR